MKTFTILFASAMMLGGVAAQAHGVVKHKRLPSTFFADRPGVSRAYKDVLTKEPALAKNGILKTSATSKYLPKTESLYEYDGENWEKVSDYLYTYDDNGNVVALKETSGDEVTLTETSFSDDGLQRTEIQKTSEDGGQSYTNSTKLVQKYDPIVSNLVVEKLRYVWDETANDWVATTDAYKRDIVRDAYNNITNLQISVPYDGAYDAIQRYTNTVDPQTKQISTYKFEELGYDDYYNPVWETSEYLTNLKWKETNGQLVSQYDEWMQWGNKLLSANLSYDENGETVNFADITVDYKDDGGYTEVFNYTDALERTTTTKTINDENGSYSLEIKTIEDLDGDEVLTDGEISDWEKEVYKYDAHKNIVEEEMYFYDEEQNGLLKAAGNKYDYTYDAGHGDAIKESVMSEYDIDAMEYMPATKIVVDSYVDVTTGVDTLKPQDDAEAEVYNMQGMKLDASAVRTGKGLYIIKKGNNTVKVLK